MHSCSQATEVCDRQHNCTGYCKMPGSRTSKYVVQAQLGDSLGVVAVQRLVKQVLRLSGLIVSSAFAHVLHTL